MSVTKILPPSFNGAEQLIAEIMEIPSLVWYCPLNEPAGATVIKNVAPATVRTLDGTPTGATAGEASDVGRAWGMDGNDKIAWGNILGDLTKLTVFFRLYIRAGSSGNQETIFGHGNRRWFFIFGASTTNFRFTIKSTTEKHTGNTTFTPSTNTWYNVFGSYDPDGGANNIKLRVYDSDGALSEEKSATITGAIDAVNSALEIGHDPLRNFFVNIRANHLAVFNEVLSDEEMDAVALFAKNAK